eukprot:CAMPEP_0196207490 /NCGR_PEP_ID=MMETSP0912-20130531/8459_1 /TAXON_ID=49265 /ORGANISM="Thalassiosira rotula, Strain GSO102" /LENGTH=37 /DNA_ID= /DNA_START= /DNA_END= /DNA_ORIENTATION=
MTTRVCRLTASLKLKTRPRTPSVGREDIPMEHDRIRT